MRGAWRSMIDMLDDRAARYADKPAFLSLSDKNAVELTLTFSALRREAGVVACALASKGAAIGDRALLVFPPGLEFFPAFFGCLLAGVVGVPMLPPRRLGRQDASDNILADCAPRFLLTSEKLGTGPRDDLVDWSLDRKLELLSVRAGGAGARDEDGWAAPQGGCDLAFLQYTSGSTSSPKGVMVTHDNLLENLEMIARAFGNTERSTYVSWLPLHHDMGLILNALQALYCGASCVLTSPVAFLQRPIDWLRAISAFRAEIAGGPNFAYDLCVSRFRAEAAEGLDLSCWRVAFNGAEPVRPETLRKFATTFSPYAFDPAALYPCYGMAEATLLISGGARGGGPAIRDVSRAALQANRIAPPGDPADVYPIAGCGRVVLSDSVAIVDPDSFRRLGADQIGEIWVRGAHVARGYWRNPAATEECFRAEIEGEVGAAWLRTGDLGFLDARGELYVTGRIKDLIIVRGVNHYPQDIEFTAQATDLALRSGYGAAFMAEDSRGQEKLIIVQEVERSHRRKIDATAIADAIREAVSEAHGLSVHEVVLVAPGTIPKTTSGKIQRRLARQLWREGGLPAL